MKQSIDSILANAVRDGHAPNLAAVVIGPDGLIYEGGTGKSDSQKSAQVGADTAYRLASMTKLITTVAVLQLIDQGKLDTESKVVDFVPEFGKLQVLERMEGDTPVLRDPIGTATVRHLLTHTSGLSYWFFNSKLHAWEGATGTPNVLAGDSRAFTAPLVADPGTQFDYGMSTDYLGKIIEKVSNQSLPDYIAEHVTGPLGMTETTFRPDEALRAKLVPVYVPDGEGGFIATEIDWPTEPDWWAGGHALYSTPRDYAKLQRMLLLGGELNGKRILSKEMVTSMFEPQMGELNTPEKVVSADPASTCDFTYGHNRTWGWGLLLNREQDPGMRAPLSGGWAGLANTYYWIDPTTGVAGAIYSQILPFSLPGMIQVYSEFERAVYAGLDLK